MRRLISIFGVGGFILMGCTVFTTQIQEPPGYRQERHDSANGPGRTV